MKSTITIIISLLILFSSCVKKVVPKPPFIEFRNAFVGDYKGTFTDSFNNGQSTLWQPADTSFNYIMTFFKCYDNDSAMCGYGRTHFSTSFNFNLDQTTLCREGDRGARYCIRFRNDSVYLYYSYNYGSHNLHRTTFNGKKQ